MATVTFTVTPASAPVGATVTGTYTITGADTVDHSVTVNPGTVVLDGVTLASASPVTYNLTHVKTIGAPTATGHSWVTTANPLVFTAVVPAG